MTWLQKRETLGLSVRSLHVVWVFSRYHPNTCMSICQNCPYRCGSDAYTVLIPYLHLVHVGMGSREIKLCFYNPKFTETIWTFPSGFDVVNMFNKLAQEQQQAGKVLNAPSRIIYSFVHFLNALHTHRTGSLATGKRFGTLSDMSV